MKKEKKELLEKIKCFDKVEKLEIVNYLIDKQEATLDSISRALRIKNSTVYKYINQMLKAGILSHRKLPGKKGKLIFKIEDVSFSINQQKIKSAFKAKEQSNLLIIFDVDDTLVRRSDIPEQLASAGKNAIKEAKLLLQEKGIPISLPPEELFSADWIFSKYGNPIEWYMITWLSVAGVPEGKIKENLVRKYVKEYYKHIEITAIHCKLFKDVKPFLEKLKDKAYFAAISNSSNKTITETFRNNNILKYFIKEGKPLIIGGDQIPKSKETIEAILKIADIGTKHSFLIGDTGGDIKVAREAGIPSYRTIAVSRKIIPIEHLKAIRPPVRIIKNLLEAKSSIFS